MVLMTSESFLGSYDEKVYIKVSVDEKCQIMCQICWFYIKNLLII